MNKFSTLPFTDPASPKPIQNLKTQIQSQTHPHTENPGNAISKPRAQPTNTQKPSSRLVLVKEKSKMLQKKGKSLILPLSPSSPSLLSQDTNVLNSNNNNNTTMQQNDEGQEQYLVNLEFLDNKQKQKINCHNILNESAFNDNSNISGVKLSDYSFNSAKTSPNVTAGRIKTTSSPRKKIINSSNINRSLIILPQKSNSNLNSSCASNDCFNSSSNVVMLNEKHVLPVVEKEEKKFNSSQPNSPFLNIPHSYFHSSAAASENELQRKNKKQKPLRKRKPQGLNFPKAKNKAEKDLTSFKSASGNGSLKKRLSFKIPENNTAGSAGICESTSYANSLQSSESERHLMNSKAFGRSRDNSTVDLSFISLSPITNESLSFDFNLLNTSTKEQDWAQGEQSNLKNLPGNLIHLSEKQFSRTEKQETHHSSPECSNEKKPIEFNSIINLTEKFGKVFKRDTEKTVDLNLKKSIETKDSNKSEKEEIKVKERGPNKEIKDLEESGGRFGEFSDELSNLQDFSQVIKQFNNPLLASDPFEFDIKKLCNKAVVHADLQKKLNANKAKVLYEYSVCNSVFSKWKQFMLLPRHQRKSTLKNEHNPSKTNSKPRSKSNSSIDSFHSCKNLILSQDVIDFAATLDTFMNKRYCSKGFILISQ
jgi:hypothetical protein